MTTRLLVQCDGTWPPPSAGRCTAYVALPRVRAQHLAEQLREHGWQLHDGVALCPAHVRIAAGGAE